MRVTAQKRLVRLISISAFLLLPPVLFGQGSLTPPGAPAATMRTLDQVEPRRIISQPISPATLPITITAEGSYYLTTNIVAPAGHTDSGIIVNASNVTIDLNGFELAGVTGSVSGISVGVGSSNITVRNGTIRNWGSNGIDGVGNARMRIESVRAISNGGTGFFLDAGTVALNCTTFGNGSSGIVTSAHSLIRDCEASANGVFGFNAGSGSVVQGCAANGNTSTGIKIFDAGTITTCSVSASGINGTTTANIDGIVITKNCSVSGTTSNGNTGLGLRVSASGSGNGAVITGSTFNLNTLGGILADDSAVTNCVVHGNGNSTTTQGIDARGALISGCTVSGNQGYGIYVPTNGSRIVGNLVFSNSSTGIHVTAPTGGNVLDGNTITSNSGLGINLTTAGNLSVRNIAHGNTLGNFSALAGNANAQVITGGSNFTNTDPTANISY